MKKVFLVFKRDLKKVLRNAMAMIVIVGITVIPSLYAWFNIAANWDPYGATNGIKVAVANNDSGTVIEGLSVNLGDNIVESLKGNNKIGWEFTDEDEAVSGTQSGKYYAAIVIPDDFSSCLSSVLSADIKRPKMIYYSNEKKNAIAPKITDKGASSIQAQVNETFISTATTAVDTFLKNAVNTIEDDNNDIVGRMLNLLEEGKNDLIDTEEAITAFSDTVDSISSLIDTVDTATPKTEEIADQAESALSDLKSLTKSVSSATDSVASSVSSITQSAQSIGSSITVSLNDAYALAQTDSAAALDKLNSAYSGCSSIYEMNSRIRQILQSVNDSLPVRLSSIDHIIGLIDTNQNALTRLMNRINDGISLINSNRTLGASIKNDYDTLISEVNGGIDSIRSDYSENVRPAMSASFSDLYSVFDDTEDLLESVKKDTPDVQKIVKQLDTALESSKRALESTSGIIETTRERIEKTKDDIESIRDDERVAKLLEILENDPEILSEFMASPVEIETQPLYEIANYGSAMAPFYSTLAIWVGGVVLVAILKTNVKKADELRDIKPRHEYFGRYLLFFVIGILQSALICLGDLFFLNIQCVHPWLFLLAGFVSSFVFTMIIFTLTVSFGDVGKALSVILLVIQIGGSGGTFPIECTPAFFQNVYPFLPFTYAINAMRECVAGTYGTAYLQDILALLAFVPIALLLGLVLRKPLISVNHFFEKRLKDTDIM